MADIVKLKKKAADFEAKKQIDKALEVYAEIVEAYEAGDEDTVDIPLYNRVGDMLQKSGKVGEAVDLWEKAVDRYAEGGFYNPAIALCNKILRHSPGRTVIYYKLGKIHAEKGFKGDARQNFLEYASRQQKAGKLDEAFRALKEFADLVPDQHDVRVMLADQLVKAGRKAEAIAQLQLGYSQATTDNNTDAAALIVAKIKEIDPSVEPEATASTAAVGGGGLVFLDTGDEPPVRRPSGRTTVADVKRASQAVKGLELLEPPPILAPAAPKPIPTPPAAPAVSAPASPVAPEPIAASNDLMIESTSLGADAPPPRGSLLGLEVTNLAEEAPVADLPLLDLDEPAEQAADIPLLDLDMPTEESADLPLLDVEPEVEVPVDLPRIEAEPSIGLEPTALESALTQPPTDDLALLEVEHSGSVDVPTFDAPSPVADLPLMDLDEPEIALTPELVPELAAEVELEVEAEYVEPPTVPSPATRAARASQGLPMLSLDEDVQVVEVEVPSSAPQSVALLRARVDSAPDDWAAHRHLAEALLEEGQRDEAMTEFERAMAGFEATGDLDTAGSVAEEIVRLDPKSIRSHQKRVEFAFRANDRVKLAEAYLELADALLADGQAQKARTVYQRVLDITPDDIRAQAAIESIPLEEPPEPPPAPRRSTTVVPKPAKVAPATSAPTAIKKDADDEFVSLGDWLREDDEPKNTRMVVEEKEPTGDEAADFSDMLRAFKAGVAENVDEEDHEAHYDLGVAYKEMGLVDEAISEFQKALRGTKSRARTFEALGNCFIEKQQLPVAATIMQRALNEPGTGEEALVGVLYLLGAIAEEQKQFAEAKKFYERVFAVDIQFRDIGDRLNTVEQQLS